MIIDCNPESEDDRAFSPITFKEHIFAVLLFFVVFIVPALLFILVEVLWGSMGQQ